MKTGVFEAEILRRIKNMDGPYVDVTSGDVHRTVGGYPGRNHRMPMCCQAMKNCMRGDDKVLYAPPSGKGATLKVRYYRLNH